MTRKQPCPNCDSLKVMAVPDSDRYLCYDCKHEFVPENVVTPLRIFLSYGHDDNEPLVRRIKADLEARNHDVWFDKTPETDKGIRAGDDWRRAITDGILKSHRVVSFLSQHSTRDPGVYGDEIAIARFSLTASPAGPACELG